MEKFNVSDAKQKFDEVLVKAQHESVGINKNGKPVAVVISATKYAYLESLKEEHLRQAIQKGIADLQAGKVTDGETVINKSRKRIIG